MAGVLLLLSLCAVTVTQMTSSQSTYDIIQQGNDVNSCERTEETNSLLMTAMSQLQKDVAELKAAIKEKDVKGMTKAKTRGIIQQQSNNIKLSA